MVGLMVAVLAMGAGVAAWLLPSGPGSDEPPAGYTPAHATLLATYDGRYPIEPRVWGSANGAAYAEAKEAEPATALAFGGEELGWRLEAEAQIERDLRENLSAEARAASGVRHLLNGTTDRAIAALEAARLERPDDPRILNDLAAAYLTSGLEGNRPLHLLEGLELARQVTVMAPNSPETLYNLALALGALHLNTASERAWGDYLEIASDGGLRRRAQRYLRTVRLSSGRGSGTDGRSLVPAELTQPATGAARLLAEGIRLYEEYQIDEARRLFNAAAQDLSGSRDSRFLEAMFYLGLCHYQESDYDQALEFFDRIVVGDAVPQGREALTLAGRSQQTRGLIYGVRGQYGKALRAYSSSLHYFEAAGNASLQARAHSAMAEIWRLLGNSRGAWDHRYKALRAAGGLDPRQRAAVFAEAAASALQDEKYAAAADFADALLEVAEASHNIPAVVAGFRSRALASHHRGNYRAALKDLDEAGLYARAIPDQSVAEVTVANVLLTRGEILFEIDPSEAIATLEQASEILEVTDLRALLPRLLGLLSRARRSSGDATGAAKDLAEALAEVEVQARNAPDLTSRFSLTQTSRPLFDEAIRLALEEGAPALAGLDLVERAQAAAWSVPGRRRRGAATSTTAGIGRLDADTDVLVFRSLGDRLVVWRLARDRVRRHDLGLVGKTVASMALSFQRSGGEVDLRLVGESLYSLILDPIVAAAPLRERVVVVPDGPLFQIPIAALRNPQTDRYLVEDAILLVAPSLPTLFSDPGSSLGESIRSVLAVSNPATDVGLFGLPRLPGSGHEVAKIRGSFAHVTELSDGDATPAKVRELLPRHDAFHFAGHAVANIAYPELSYLLLAPEQDADDGGPVFAKDLLHLAPPVPRLVFLSACRSGDGGVGGATGLAGAFVAAGVPAVISGLWEIEDGDAARLVAGFYRWLASGEEPAGALALAQRELIGPGASPTAWAPFQVTGTLEALANH